VGFLTSYDRREILLWVPNSGRTSKQPCGGHPSGCRLPARCTGQGRAAPDSSPRQRRPR